MNQKIVFLILALMFLFTTNMPAAKLPPISSIAPSIEIISSELKETATTFNRWLQQDNVPNRINFRTRSGFVLLRKEDIIFLKIDVKSGDLLLHYRKEGQIRKASIQASLASVLDKLNAFPFLKINRSTIVNINEATEFEGTRRDAHLVMNDASKIKVSRSNSGVLHDWINSLSV